MKSHVLALPLKALSGPVDKTKLYKLPGNKSEAGPGSMLFFDTETHWDPVHQYEACQMQRLRLGCAIAGRLEADKWTRESTCEFSTKQQFWEFVKSRSDKKRPLWVFGHNIGYDLAIIGVPEMLRSGELIIWDGKSDGKRQDMLGQKYLKTDGFICLDNPPVILSCKHTDGFKMIFVDTFNYWTTSLAKIGEMVGCRKLDMPAITEDDKAWFKYCMADVEVVKQAVLGLVKWVKENNLGKFRFTAPSQAMAAFRHRWNKPPIVCHNNIKLRKFERQAYYGGRLECFYIGEVTGNVYELDVTSLYPSVMQSNLYPVQLLDWYHPQCHTTRKPVDLDMDCVAEVWLKTLQGFPVRDNRFGTYYPIGEYWTTLAGPELMRAKRSGVIQEVRAWSRYKMDRIFTGFVDFFWDYRKKQALQGNELNASLAKLLMNGLYGKFGQLTNAWTERPDIRPCGKFGIYTDDEHADKNGAIFRQIGTMVLQHTGKLEHPFAFPAIAAYVTSYAREWMLTLREAAGFKNCYYLVTDALFTNQTGYDRLDIGGFIRKNDLGFLRVKHKSDIATFKTLHHYSIGEHSVNGSRKKNHRVNSDGSITEIQFESLEKILSREPDGSVHVKPITKHYNTEYKRGLIGVDGWVTPFTLTET